MICLFFPKIKSKTLGLSSEPVISEICENKDEILKKEVFPNVIHNRFDLLYSAGNASSMGGGKTDYSMYSLAFENKVFYVPVYFEGKEAKVGMYLRKLEKEYFNALTKFLFFKHQKLERIRVLHTYTTLESVQAGAHWHIDLPQTVAEFEARLHKKTRYNTKWYPKKIRENIGEYQILRLDPREALEEVLFYFEWKKKLYGYVFEGTAEAYLRQAGVTSVYVMKHEQMPLAVGFLAETGENVFLENLGYDPRYQRLSLGSVLYYHMIKEMILQKKKVFYLLGGRSEYKKHFNGTCTMTYTGDVFRCNKLARLTQKIAVFINALPFSYRLRKKLAKFLGLFMPRRYYAKYLKECICR